MNSSIQDFSLIERTKELYYESLLNNYVRTDRMFFVLMPVQWIISMIIAFSLSPQTWNGTASATHQHVYAAIFFGGALSLVPLLLVWLMPGSLITRLTIAASQLLMCGLLIHLTDGRTSTHFYIFGSLAFLAFYRDWKVIVAGTVVTALDHVFRGVWYPESIFGLPTMNVWMIVEHSLYVVFEDVFLFIGCAIAAKEMWLMATKRAEVEFTGRELETEKREVERSADEAERQKAYLSESVSKLLAAMNKFADGDLRVKVDAETETDEMGRLIKGFNDAVAKTGNLLKQMTEAVNTTAAAADEIRISTEELADQAESQLMQSKRATVTIDEMQAAAAENSEVVRLTAESVSEGGKSAVSGKTIVSKAVDKMNQIAEIVRTSTAVVDKLGASSNEIGKIVSLINEIARQTNLLALNAAVEAARAGEQGAGFAVVASEVRQLALRTTEATMQISEVISNIQSETAEAINTMRVGSKEVEEGISLSNQTNEALEMIVISSEGITERVERVVTVNQAQTESSQKVTVNVSTISQTAEQSARSVQSITDSIFRLNQMTEDLRVLTSQFKLENEERKPQPSAGGKAQKQIFAH